MEPINKHRPPGESWRGLDIEHLSDKHLKLLIDGFARQLGEGRTLSTRDEDTYRTLLAVWDDRRMARQAQGAA